MLLLDVTHTSHTLARTGIQGGEKRKAQWPAAANWRSRVRRILGQSKSRALSGTCDGLIKPELFGPPTWHVIVPLEPAKRNHLELTANLCADARPFPFCVRDLHIQNTGN